MKLSHNDFINRKKFDAEDQEVFERLIKNDPNLSIIRSRYMLIAYCPDMDSNFWFDKKDVSDKFKRYLYCCAPDKSKEYSYGVVAKSEQTFNDYVKVNDKPNVRLHWIDPENVNTVRGYSLDGIVILDGVSPAIMSVVFPAINSSKHTKTSQIRGEINELRNKINELEKKL